MKINSFIHACKILGRDPVKSLPKVSSMPKRDQKSTIANAKLSAICQASWSDHPEWKKKGPDWDNPNQYKWQPYFWMNSPGFRFSVSYYSYSSSSTTGGSRLRFASEEESNWHANKHLKLYKDLMVIPK